MAIGGRREGTARGSQSPGPAPRPGPHLQGLSFPVCTRQAGLFRLQQLGNAWPDPGGRGETSPSSDTHHALGTTRRCWSPAALQSGPAPVPSLTPSSLVPRKSRKPQLQLAPKGSEGLESALLSHTPTTAPPNPNRHSHGSTECPLVLPSRQALRVLAKAAMAVATLTAATRQAGRGSMDWPAAQPGPPGTTTPHLLFLYWPLFLLSPPH